MGFNLPTVTKCCFCVPLRIASLLIGYFSILASCLTLVTISLYTYKVAEFVKDSENHHNTNHTSEEIQKNALSLYISFAYYMLVFLYNLVINVLLVVGVHTNKPQLLRIYVNTMYFLLALAIALIILTSIFMGILATLALLKWAVTLVVVIVIVRSTYLEMEEQNKPKTYEMQNLYMPPQQAPTIV